MPNLLTASFQKIKVISGKGNDYIYGYINYSSSYSRRILNRSDITQLFTNDKLHIGDIISVNNKNYKITALIEYNSFVGAEIYAISELRR